MGVHGVDRFFVRPFGLKATPEAHLDDLDGEAAIVARGPKHGVEARIPTSVDAFLALTRRPLVGHFILP
jgi:hypothetical protein